ncbi:MATE family efflux transporter [Mycoplasma marinum]|uniref:MATE family efflux transporter n=1 Tax=Mycoplasma marinum TaxID=1937190 RepID=A0A4R0XM54_9MOLU|nr:MATE family efflux transporter [Mycoplasma marinum]TCG11776.1 hypothetical protein C4B24_01335 [Mycoplasma marinum]
MSNKAVNKISSKDKRREMFIKTPMWKLLIKMCLPGVIIMSIMGIYNFSDNILAINFASDSYMGGKPEVRLIMASIMPMMNIGLAIIMMVTVGTTTRVSINLGKGDIERAKNTVKTGMMVGMLLMIISSPIIIACTRSWIDTQIPSGSAIQPEMREEILKAGFNYTLIISAMQLVFFFNNMVSSLLRTEGRMKEATLAMFIPVIFNLLADYLLMGPGGMGIEGAATATAIADLITTIVLVLCIIKNKKSIIRFKNLFGFKFAMISMVGIILVGVAPLFRNAAQSFTGTLQMTVIKDVSNAVFGNDKHMTWVLTSTFPIFGLFFPLLFGIVQGAAPVASYNYGAGEIKRVKQATILAFLYTLILGAIIWLFSTVILAEPLMSALGVDESIRPEAKKALMILMLGAPLFSAAIAGMVLFSSTDRVAFSLISSAARGFILFVPMIFLFKYFSINNTNNIYVFWWMWPTLAFSTCLLIVIMIIITWRKLEEKHTTLDERVEVINAKIIAFSEKRKIKKQAKKDSKEKNV